MKKKSLLLVLSSLSLGLVGCDRTSETTTEPPTEPPASESTSEVHEPLVSITSRSATYEVEVQATVSARFTITPLKEEAQGVLTATFSSPDDGTLIEIETTSPSTSCRIKGIQRGTATLIATSVADPEVSCTVTIEVIARKSPLRTVWNNIYKLNSYTLTTYDYDVSEEPLEIIKVNEDGIFHTDSNGQPAIAAEDSFLKAYINGTLGYEDETTAFKAIYGLSVTSDDRVVFLGTDSTDALKTSEQALTGAAGLLHSSNFRGNKTDSTNPNDYAESIFVGLEAVNSTWLTNTKSDDNTYEIVGSDSDEDFNAAMTECLLWSIVDIEGYYDTMHSGKTSFTELAAAINTTITVVNNNTVSIAIENVDTQQTITAVMSEGDTTQTDSTISAFLAGKTAEKPALPALTQQVLDKINENDYYTYHEFTSGASMVAYYTPNYIYAVQTNAAGVTSGLGVIVKNNVAYYFEVTYTITEETTTAAISKVEHLFTNDSTYEGTIVQLDAEADLAGNFGLGYYSNTALFSNASDNDLIYTLQQYTSTDNTQFLQANGKEVSDDLFYVFSSGSTLDEYASANNMTVDEYVTQISNFTYDGTELKSFRFFFGLFGDGGYGYTDTLNFGATTANELHSTITDYDYASHITAE